MTQYSFSFDTAQAGQIADSSLRIVDSFIANATIQYGVAVKRDSTNANTSQTCILPWADAITVPFLGVAVFTQAQEHGYQSPYTQYLALTTVPVLTMGRVYVNVKTSVTVTAGDSAYVEATTGLFTNVATDNLLIGNFLTSGTGGTDLIILEIGN